MEEAIGVVVAIYLIVGFLGALLSMHWERKSRFSIYYGIEIKCIAILVNIFIEKLLQKLFYHL